MKPLVELHDVKMFFSSRRGIFKTTTSKALDGVSLKIERNKTVAIVGESGSGKTTLGKVSTKLLTPTHGRVVYDGKDITDEDEPNLKWLRRKAQTIFQDPYSSIDPFMNAAQTLEEPLIIHGLKDRDARKERIRKALEDVKLQPAEDFLKKYPHMLSGGQRQRVGIARALMTEPEYVVADEPVSMIDASSRAEILYLMREIRDKYGLAFLYITHDIATAKHFSDQLAVMYLGRIVEFGPPQDIVREPLHPYTIGLIEAVPEPDPLNRFRERKVVAGEPPNAVLIPPACRFHPRCPFFMKGRCDTIDPELKEVKPGRFVACHLY